MSTFTASPADGSAWVTGASSGIGKALALNLAADGFTVYATARSEDALAELAGEAEKLKGRIVAAPGDVTDSQAMAGIAGH
jgi:NADP-dependent 3-hydroxy acid dehydrogenase YdfG